MSYNNTRTYMKRMRFPMKIFVLFMKSQFVSKLSAVKFHCKIIYIYIPCQSNESSVLLFI